jgi:hypothetical protein
MASHDHNYISYKTTNPVDDGNLLDIQRINDDLLLNSGKENEQWQTVLPRHSKRNQTSSPENCQKRYRTDLATTKTSSEHVPLRNNFQPLANHSENNMEEETIAPQAEKDMKPPPIFLPGVTKVAPMIKALDELVSKTGYSYKCLNQDRVKLFPSTPDDYRKIVRGLTDLNVSFHTYQLKQERAYRVVLKNMHYSTCTDRGLKIRNRTTWPQGKKFDKCFK